MAGGREGGGGRVLGSLGSAAWVTPRSVDLAAVVNSRGWRQ